MAVTKLSTLHSAPSITLGVDDAVHAAQQDIANALAVLRCAQLRARDLLDEATPSEFQTGAEDVWRAIALSVARLDSADTHLSAVR